MNRCCVGSTPTGHPDASAARRAEHRSRKAGCVGSSPTAGSDRHRGVPPSQAVHLPLGCLIASGVAQGEGVVLKPRRPLVRVQPPELVKVSAIAKVVLLGEQPVSKAGGVGSNPTGLAHRPGKGPGASLRRSPGEDRFLPRPGRCRSGRGRAARQPSHERYEAGSTPAGPTPLGFRGAAECSPPSHGGGRWFESSRDY